MGFVNFSIPKDIVDCIIKSQRFDNFVETGTYKGVTAFWAASVFKKVYTIEISPEISRETASQPGRPQNIEFLVGNSKDVLKEVMPRINGRSFFWLDGHWCSGAGGKDEECPLMAELEAISGKQDSVIFIDDARCFLGPLPPPHNASDWPLIDEIIVKVKQLFPAMSVTIIDDVIICVPGDVKPALDNYWMETFSKRYDLSALSAPPPQAKKKSLAKKIFKKIGIN